MNKFVCKNYVIKNNIKELFKKTVFNIRLDLVMDSTLGESLLLLAVLNASKSVEPRVRHNVDLTYIFTYCKKSFQEYLKFL